MKMPRRILALLLAALMVAAMALSSGAARAQSTEKGYQHYENDAVEFAMDVPEDFDISEPYDNAVFFSSGNDFRVSAEYTFYTADNVHFIQSAADFASFIEADPAVLADWVGVSELEIQGSAWGEVNGAPCYVCAYSLTQSGENYSGAIYLFDGKGDFGCYCLQVMVRDNASGAEEFVQQTEHIVQSFTVTGPYQGEGYSLYELESEGAPMQFFARDTAEVKQISNGAAIYPVDRVFTEARVNIRQTSFESSYDVADAIEGVTSYYFTYRDDAQFIAQPSHFDLGRYSYDMVQIGCSDEGVHYTVCVALFVSGGYYWLVSSEATDEYVDQVAAAFSDTLFSLRANGDGAGMGAAVNAIRGGVNEVLDVIEDQEGFESGEDGWMEPLGCVLDLDGGGQLLAAVYETVIGTDYSVRTEVWLLEDGAAALLTRNELYKEVGGNSGRVSLVRKSGTVYLALECNLWEGDRFNDYYAYLPLNERDACFDEGVYMEAHGTVGQEDEGQYNVDGKDVSLASFDAAQGSYSLLMGPLDILQGHGNGDVMDFDGLRHFYPD